MIKIALLLHNLIFYSVIGSALLCFSLTSIRILKKRDYGLIPFAVFYLLSASVSFLSIFQIKLEQQNLMVLAFYTFDILFFLFYMLKFDIIKKNKTIILTVIIIIFCLSFPFAVNFFGFTYSRKFDLFYQIIILYLLIPTIIGLLKDVENKIEIRQSEFWFIGAFFFFNFSTLASTLLLNFIEEAKNLKILTILCYNITTIAWIIKYFLLLKSTKCHRKLITSYK